MDRHAVIIPGGRHGPFAGLLAYAGAAAARRDAKLELISWTPPDDRPLLESWTWVHDQVTSVVEKLPAPLLIGKSLGSYGAGVAAARALPAVWLTPLLTMPACAEALSRATKPFLLVGGTADEYWDGEVARELTPHVFEVAGADHGMLVPGPLRDSADVLGRILTAIEAFLDDVVWR
ncbi:alpha/beta hydrolase [Nonomuraea turkmeniaca]|uniref:Alpha/beta hydrolase n=1 Tax=Nonomuraea turkmeniaca TaxID=103838 RepID=A0A5S4EVK8_9ACTN|nr:alpha/beta hydrolase [Nonomuraea turkmeniaca]TMR07397.1 alpha/beta hydrolase [Nonomuraea turkmeniaca]